MGGEFCNVAEHKDLKRRANLKILNMTAEEYTAYKRDCGRWLKDHFACYNGGHLWFKTKVHGKEYERCGKCKEYRVVVFEPQWFSTKTRSYEW